MMTSSFPALRSVPRLSLLASATTVLTLLLLAGCGAKPDSPEAPEHAHETEGGVTFNAQKGLSVSRSTAEFIGLQTADVEERVISTTFEFSAQVYRTSGDARSASLNSSAPVALASATIPPAQSAKLTEAQTVSVQTEKDGLAVPGRIVSLNRDLARATGQVEVLLAIDTASNALAPGTFVRVTSPLGSARPALAVPRAAVLRTSEGDFVYTVSGEHFVRAKIQLGATNEQFAAVTEALYEGDQVVVHPVMTLWMAELQSLRGGKS
ncbi:MAG: efflux RND transporter periplasmic adaptor subunit, partial [Verrucomicrobiota bacterium]